MGFSEMWYSVPLKKATSNIKQFETGLKCYLLTHSLYAVDEYFNVNKQ
jgi:hypothetical protein